MHLRKFFTGVNRNPSHNVPKIKAEIHKELRAGQNSFGWNPEGNKEVLKNKPD
jgi:hypothetical protein